MMWFGLRFKLHVDRMRYRRRIILPGILGSFETFSIFSSTIKKSTNERPKYLKNNISREDSPSEDRDISQVRFRRVVREDLLELQSYLKNIWIMERKRSSGF